MKKIITTVLVILIMSIMGGAVLAVTATVTTDELNIRESASTSSNAIGLLNTGDKINIISTEGDWYKIDYQGKEGYIKKDYAKEDDEVETNKDNNTTNKENNIDTINTQGKQTLMNDVDLYILPLLNSTNLKTLTKGTQYKIISNNGKWVYIQTDKDSGWIISEKNASQTVQTEKKEEKKEEKNEANTISNEVANDLEENTVAENSSSNKIEENNADEYPVTMRVNTDSVYIRSSASADSESITGRTEGAELTVIGKEGDWYKVRTQDGIGYVKSEFLSK